MKILKIKNYYLTIIIFITIKMIGVSIATMMVMMMKVWYWYYHHGNDDGEEECMMLVIPQ